MTHPASDISAPYRPWPHRLAVALVCATFPLIWVGGLVTTYEAGMAVPDWPNTYGYNLFLYPPSTWLSGPFDLFIEHGHRLLGAAVGLLTLATAATLWRQDARVAVRRLAVAAVGLVILQGLLGGLRVLADERLLAQAHGCTGPAFFAVAVALAVCTSRAWLSPGTPRAWPGGDALRRLALTTTLVAYLQLVLGSWLRHMPPGWSHAAFQAAVLAHLAMAAVLTAHVLALALRCRRLPADLAWVSRRGAVLAALLVAQLALGSATWVSNYGWPAWARRWAFTEGYVVTAESMSQALVTTAHVATGSLILVVALSVALAAWRWLEGTAGAAIDRGRTGIWGEAA